MLMEKSESIVNLKENKKQAFSKLKAFFNNIFSNPFKTTLYTGCLIFSIMIIYFIVVRFARNNFYAAFSDDIFQYYPMMIDFVNRIKNGTLGFFNYSNYLGASVFADTYYVPLDPFTFIILLLSYIIPTEIAMSLVELLKLTLGSMAFMLYMSYKGMKPKWVHLMGILFFSSSGITCFSCFSSFTSLAFFLPMSLNIAYWFKKGKWYYVPLFTSVVVLYNYYLAYTVFAFMAFSILFMLILDKEIWYKVIYKTVIYVGLIILGLMFSMAVFLPSTLYILKSTTRSVVEEGSSLKSLIMMVKSYIKLPIELFKSIGEFIKLLFNPKVSLLKNAYMYRDSFVGIRYAYHLLSKNRTIDGINYYPAFFNKEVLYRILGSIFVPSYPSAFYGYLESYFLEHASLYITGTGVFLSTYVLFLKDYKSKIYKWIYVVMIIFMSLPFFSYIFSANLSVLYTRWVNVVTIPLLLVAGHTLNETELKDMSLKKMIISLIILLYFAFISIFHHYENLTAIAVKNNFSEELMLFEKRALASAIYLVIALAIMVVLFAVFKDKSKKFKLIAYPIIGAAFIGVFLVLGLTLLSYFNTLGGDAIFDTRYVGSNPLYDRDSLIANQYMTFITVIVLILFVYFVKCNKKKLLIGLITFEFIFSACLSFGAPIISYGEAGSYKKTREVAKVVKANTPKDDMYRVYVDSSITNLERENLARFFNDKGTNQSIFHSFINASTDNVAGILFDKRDEGQANKEALNVYSYYLNVLLGYKYVVAERNSSFENYDEDMFEEIYKDDNYILLEFKDFEEFLVYDKFITLDSFNSIKSKINKLSRMNFLNKYGIVEEEFYDVIGEYLGNESEEAINYIDKSQSKSFGSKSSVKEEHDHKIYGDIEYKVFDIDMAYSIDTRSYALNLYNIYNIEELVEEGGIYLEFDNGTVYYLQESNIRSMNGSDIHIPVYGWDNKDASINGDGVNIVKANGKEAPRVKYIGIDKDKYVSSYLSFVVEAIFNESKELVNYENYEECEETSLAAYFRFKVTLEKDKMVNISSTEEDLGLSHIVVEYTDGTFEYASTEFMVDKNIKYIYISKGSMTDKDYNPAITVSSFDISEPYTDNYWNKSVKVKGSNITVSYDRTTKEEGYEIIMVPTAYSSEWKLVEGNVKEIISVDGGFIGLIVPKNIDSNKIVIKFVPMGYKIGLTISLSTLMLYVMALMTFIIIKRKRGGKRNEETNNSSSSI